jgi:hypothetical protein
MFQSFTVLQCSHQHCVQPVVSDVEVVGYLLITILQFYLKASLEIRK